MGEHKGKYRSVGAIGLGMTLAGSILGAGYVSGQELHQYFGAYGNKGIIGLVISIILIAAFSYAVTWVGAHCNSNTVDSIVLRFDNKVLRTLSGALFTLIYYMITIVMIAGISSLCEQLLGISRLPVAVITTVIVMVIVYFGVDGMLAVFSFSVPVLIVAAMIICAIQIFGDGLKTIEFMESDANPLLGGWLFSSVNYAMCNGYASTGVLAPVACRTEKDSERIGGIIIGSVILLSIAMAILAAMATAPEAVNDDLPMLAVAQRISTAVGYIYGVLLFLAMFGNAVSTFVAVMHYLLIKYEAVEKHKLLVIVILGIISCSAGMMGFSTLVGIVYPVIGYIGIVTALLVAEHIIHIKRTESMGRFGR